MGTRGPQPTPLKLIEARGSKRARKRGNEPKFDPSDGKWPEWIDCTDKVARDWYARMAEDLVKSGVLTVADECALAMGAKEYSTYRKMTAILDKDGFTTKGNRGRIVKHPAYVIQQRAYENFRRTVASFGLTPSARASVSVAFRPGPKDPAADAEDDSKEGQFKPS